MDNEPGPDDGQIDPGCSWCERGSGMVLIVGAVGLLYIGFDLLTGGALSRLFAGAAGRIPGAVDDVGDQAATIGGELETSATDEPAA